MGPSRLPQGAQNPLDNINAFAYPAPSTPGSLGGSITTGLWLIWPQWSASKTYTLKERYKFSIRVDANSIPVHLKSTIPDANTNISRPATFGRFGLQASSATISGANG
jgi:hypothetical protein